MKKQTFVVGIDGGGTKTTAELCNDRGVVVATTSGGPTNFQVIGVERTSETLLRVLQSCCSKAGLPVTSVKVVVAGLTGAGRAADQRLVLQGLRRIARSNRVKLPRIVIESDAKIALEAAFSGRPGVISIVGTGSIAFGKNENGTVFRVGGWGRLIGDEGSGYSIGREGLRAVARALDGGPLTTRLTTLFARKFGLISQKEIIHQLYQKNFDVASLAPLVLKAAQGRDKVSVEIVKQSARELVSIIGVLIRKMKRSGKLSVRKIPLAFAGTLGTLESVYLTALRNDIRRLPSVVLRHPDWPPVHGASLIALSLVEKGSTAR